MYAKANPVRRSSLVDDLKYDFRYFSTENVRSAVAVDTGRVAEMGMQQRVNCRIECFVAHKQSTHTITWRIVHCMAKYLPRLKFSDVGLETWSRSRDLSRPFFGGLGLGRAGLGLGLSLGTVGLGLGLGLGRPDLDNITAEIQARRTASTKHGIAVRHNDQRLLQCHEMTRSGQISAADHIALELQLRGCKTLDSSV
jgi:hypothetical protein